jgi:hypothetical protein
VRFDAGWLLLTVPLRTAGQRERPSAGGGTTDVFRQPFKPVADHLLARVVKDAHIVSCNGR